MTKAEVRKQMKEKRRILSADESEEKSRQISSLFFKTFDLKQVEYLHVFLPIARLHEINTWLIIDTIQASFPETQIVFPKVNPDDFSMDSFLYDPALILAENTWGITEPLQGKRINPQLINMVLLPLLGFDTSGFRVGYGKGYYDRFLTTCQQDVIKTGLSFEEPVQVIEDLNEFDVPMDYCITPYKVWHFGSHSMEHKP